MKVLLTGGSGNLGQTLVPVLLDKGNTPVILDVRAPRDLKKGAVFIEGSILDRPKLADIFRGCDCIVHIAAWHGIREDRGEKTRTSSLTSMCAAPSRFLKRAAEQPRGTRSAVERARTTPRCAAAA